MVRRGLLLLVMGLTLAGCPARPPYEIPGLAPPPQSDVVKVTRNPQTSKKTGKTTGRVVVVYFNNPDDWNAVVAHFDAALKPRGFEKFMEQSHGALGEQAADMLGAAYWSKADDGGHYNVILHRQGGPLAPKEAQSDYSLVVSFTARQR
jgi:hypothetical protein